MDTCVELKVTIYQTTMTYSAFSKLYICLNHHVLNLQPFTWNMFHVRKQCCMPNDLLCISSSKRSFRHMYSLFSVCAFYSGNAICQVKMRKKWGQHMGPLSVCVCACEWVSFYLFILGNWSVVSALCYSLLIRCCQPASQGGTQGLSKHSAN